MDFGTLLKDARAKKNLSQEKLAKLMGITRISISNYEQNKNEPTFANIKKLIKILDLSDDYFGESKQTKIRTIPLIGLASCGIPQEYDLNGYEPVAISEDLYEDGMYAVQAEGDSMSPKISNGAIVYCNVNRRVENGHIVHYSLDGESGIKRYKINERGDIISLIPINSDFDIITIHADDDTDLKMARVVGAVDTDF